MARHNSFGGFPGGGQPNLQQMMKQAQKLQQQMTDMTEQLDSAVYEASSGGGMVSVTIDGTHEVKSITINPQVVDPDDVEMLQDLIIAAVNEAVRKSAEDRESTMAAIPGLGNLGGLF